MTDSTKDPSAEELMQTGLHTKTIDHYYSNLSPVKKLTGWGLFESLMGDSEYEFGVEYETKSFDFSEADIQPDRLCPFICRPPIAGLHYSPTAAGDNDVFTLVVRLDLCKNLLDIHPRMSGLPRGVIGITEPAPEIAPACTDEDRWYAG